jgi:ribosome-associated protein
MAPRPADERTIDSDALLGRVVELCHERKAEDVVSLDVRGLVEYMDYMVIATGRSPRQNRAIAEHVLTQLKREFRVLPLSKAGLDAGTWICVDLVDVVLHVFEPEARAHYDLELLWGDAQRTEHPAPAAGIPGLPEASGVESALGDA